MAKLRVGDIEIDGDRISIGGQQMTGRPVATTSVSTSSLVALGRPIAPPALQSQAQSQPESLPALSSIDALQNLERLPVKSSLLLAGGLAASAVGSVMLLLTSAPLDVIGFVFHGGLLVTGGLGVMGLGALKEVATTRGKALRQARDRAELMPIVEKLRALLVQPHKTQTVEWIAQALGETEPKTVRALAHMRETGELREDLNLDGGEYFYYLEAPELPRLRGLDDRLSDLERSNKK